MTAAEFRAWFEGFTEGKTEIDAEALSRLRRVVAAIEDPPTVYPEYPPRYWPLRTPERPWREAPIWCAATKSEATPTGNGIGG